MKNTKGITLIALVVTIVVLLILAGISVSILTGENGIIGQAGEAKIETEKSEIKEQIDTMTVQSVDRVGNIDKEKLKEKLETLPDGKEIIDAGDTIYVIYPKYSFEIDVSTGNVEIADIERTTDETPWEITGEGTEEKPYLIESIEDLVAFSNEVNNGNNFKNKYVKLVKTLDFNSPFSYDDYKTKVVYENEYIKRDESGSEIKTLLTKNEGFIPIGVNKEKVFSGYFDGNGKEIRNIFIGGIQRKSNGLFGNAERAMIFNLGTSGKINLVTSQFSVYAGGIVSEIYAETKINNCCSNVNISLKNMENGSPLSIGGIVAVLTGNSEVTNCYNSGDLYGISESTKSYGASVGGITGFSQYGSIKNSYNFGEIKGKSSYILNLGGIIGYTQNEEFEISNSYNLGNIINESKKYMDEIGGIVGDCKQNIKLQRLYSYGEIFNSIEWGGIAGRIIDNTEIIDCYYLETISEKGVRNFEDITGKIQALPESEMPPVIEVVQNQIEVDGQVIDVWKEDTNNINNGYPILWWQ